MHVHPTNKQTCIIVVGHVRTGVTACGQRAALVTLVPVDVVTVGLVPIPVLTA